MRYIALKRGERALGLVKYMESKGFFRNNTGSLKVGEIKLYDNTENDRFENFLMDEEICYMELGRSKICSDENEIPSVFVGDKKNNIPVEERIKFLYEALSSNSNYNCLGIIYKDTKIGGYKKSLFEIDFNGDDDDIIMLNINDL